MAQQELSLPSALKAVYKRFEKWRMTRSNRSRIPDPLWELAVSVAKAHGIYRTSKTLRVNYQGLKRRVTAVESLAPQEKTTSPFVELDLRPPFPPTECIIELEEHNGPKMTIRLRESSSVDLIGLSSAFFGRSR